MRIASEENVLKVLTAFNPWWKTGLVGKNFTKPIKRLAYYEVLKIMNRDDIKRAVIISGARRIGKTTVMYQLIDEMLRQDVAPNRLVYISFDHPIFKLCPIGKILDIYNENIYGGSGKDTCYFFDEVQYAEDWDRWIKTIYDTQPAAKIVATGSASPILNERAKESGAGRWTVLSVPTLSFYEYCKLLKVPAPQLPQNTKPSDLIFKSHKEQVDIFLKLSPIKEHFHRYLLIGGFPELALASDVAYSQRVLREDVVDKVLKRDIPSIYNVRSVGDLEKIFLYLCYHSGSIISIDGISKELGGVTRPTVEKYIEYLESANLIYVSKQIDAGGKKSLKTQPKIYIADPAVRNAVIMQEDILSNPEDMGMIVETAVYKHVRSLYHQHSVKVGYHRTPNSRNEEVDVVVSSPRGEIFIEVKYRENYTFSGREAIVKLCGAAISNFVITKREDDFGPLPSHPEKIYRIPAYAFLYMLGISEEEEQKNA